MTMDDDFDDDDDDERWDKRGACGAKAEAWHATKAARAAQTLDGEAFMVTTSMIPGS